MSWDHLVQADVSSCHFSHHASQERWRPCPVAWSETCFSPGRKISRALSGTSHSGAAPRAGMSAWGSPPGPRWQAQVAGSHEPQLAQPREGCEGAQLEGDHRSAPCPPCQQGTIALAWAPVLAEKVTPGIAQVRIAVEQGAEL